MIFGSLSKPYVIAEIGANHNGDMKLAAELIKAAKDAGADCVKFQSWTKESIFAAVKYEENYFLQDDYRDRSDFTLAEIVEKFSVSEQELIELKSMADSLSIDFSCTPFSFEEAKFVANKLDVRFIKIASMDVNNYPFLDFVARLGKPVIISTGLCTLAEIDRAVSVFENAGNRNLAILHCVAEYPPEDSQTNLRNIDTIKKCYPEYTVGFSDHSIEFVCRLLRSLLGQKLLKSTLHWIKRCLAGITKCQRHHKSCEISVPAHNALITQLEVQEFCQLSQKSVRENFAGV